MAVGLLVAVIVVAVVVPVPDPSRLREWAAGAGAAAPVLMFLLYVLGSMVPIPRTVFSLASGLLLGPVLGALVALAATGISAVLSFGIARSVGRRLLERHLTRAPVRAVDERLTGGGWLAVASLRLIPVIPFLPTNYACGLSSVALAPYLVGTMAGSVAGTVAAVALGDAITGHTSPAAVAVSVTCAAVGAVGLWFAIRRRVPEPA